MVGANTKIGRFEQDHVAHQGDVRGISPSGDEYLDVPDRRTISSETFLESSRSRQGSDVGLDVVRFVQTSM